MDWFLLGAVIVLAVSQVQMFRLRSRDNKNLVEVICQVFLYRQAVEVLIGRVNELAPETEETTDAG